MNKDDFEKELKKEVDYFVSEPLTNEDGEEVVESHRSWGVE